MTYPVCAVRDLEKSYGRTKALRGISLEIRAGEVHALVGENGAGKSTLIKILSGQEQPSAGVVEIDGKAIEDLTPATAQACGILTVPQHLVLAEDLSVADNLFLGRWPTSGVFVDRRELHSRARSALDRVGLGGVRPTQSMQDLSYVEKQMVEVARVTEVTTPRVMILDEPTAALSVREIAILFGHIKALRATGVAVLYVSHFLNEILEISDFITILRDGEVAGSGVTSDFTTDKLVERMVGGIPDLYPRREAVLGSSVLRVESGRIADRGDISFDVHAGEVLGIAAPKGEGVSEFLRQLCCVRGRVSASRVIVQGDEKRIRSANGAYRRGLGYLSEERGRWGLISARPVRENITASREGTRRLLGWIGLKDESSYARRLASRFRVKSAGVEVPIESLSGGNQQKVLIARLLDADLGVVLLDDPTFGVDARSKADINQLLNDAVSRGLGVVLHTSDLGELVGMSDRIILIRDAQVAHEFPSGSISVTELERLLTYNTEEGNVQ